MPLWRVQWTVLPGYQNVLTISQPHYTDMFQRIIAGSGKSPRYFGHIYLPRGSENLGNPEYELKEGTKAPLVGTLMQITEAQLENDGTLTVAVQALERIKVVEVEREKPYSVATVEIFPDEELVNYHIQRANEFLQALDFRQSEDVLGAALAACVAECLEYHMYEFRKVKIKELQGGFSSLADYEGNICVSVERKVVEESIEFAMERYLCEPPSAEPQPVQNPHIYNANEVEELVEEWEYRVWVELDTVISLLRRTNPYSSQEQTVAVPAQIMSLLPQEPYKPWPEQFMLDTIAWKLSEGLIGTSTESPFVRVPSFRKLLDETETGENVRNVPGSYYYPPPRRAHRLSYVITTVLESIAVTASAINSEDTQTRNLRQGLLEITSLKDRLEKAYNQLRKISLVLSQTLEEEDSE
eukprot:CAMPEP_0194446264 /NCGR_PEP_ID=MMETSP0176-20130528/128338_1 /TAXON_ID=216777 /ORGANISM="Proboscia alata, Strain PI-D3" /LENGTH=412 /DNA_ID=CAMNT_0039272947 /DNA_START=463 /DNA_END=1701 /DNA_ORIENTATION=-